MSYGYDFDDIKSQSQFCTELMLRLNKSVQKAGKGSWSGMDKHCQKQEDIIRIRRELNTLREMLNPWAERKEEYDCNDCYYSMQNCKDKAICCEDETALCGNFEPVVEKE